MSVPSLPVAHLLRQRLLDALQGGRERLRLLCAPAGFGKTVLLSEFLQRVGSGRVVWLSLDGRQQSLPELAARVAAGLGLTPGHSASPEALLKFFESCEQPIWLALDDLPGEMAKELNDWFDRLLALQSSKLQLLVSCRQRPHWNLPRLKLLGELLELNHKQLAFSRDECEALIEQLAPEAEASWRTELWQQTVGWCAAICLLLSDPVHGGRAGPNGLSWLRQYLEHELLSRLSDDEREVLSGLAHLSRFSAEFCAQLWEEQGGGLLFRRLLQRDVFFLPLDQPDGWYRMRPVVAQALHDRLTAAELNRLRLRACRVLSVVGHLSEAIDQALGAEQHEVAANYMERLRLTWLYSDQHLSRLMSWREQIPPQLLGSTPRLLYLCARGLLFSGRLDESEACLQRLGNFLPQSSAERSARLLALWQAMQGSIEAVRGNAATARQSCRAALSQLGADDWLTILLCHITLARLAMASGETSQAQQLLQEAVELARRKRFQDGEVVLNVERLRLMILQGELPRAQALLQEDMQRVEAGNNWRNPLLGRLLFLQGELHLLGGRLAESEAALLAGLAQVKDFSAPFILHGYLLLAEVAVARGEYEAAQLHLHQAERHMHCGNIDSACYESAITLQAMRILAGQGRWEQVLTMARAMEASLQGPISRLPPAGMPSLAQRNQLLLARAEYEMGNRMQAKQRLVTLLKQCKRYQFALLANEVQQALVNLGFGDGQDELDALQQGLLQSGADSLEGEAGTDDDGEQGDLCAKTLREGYHRDELTPREVSVLRLLAEGMSNQEVSDILFISVNTVKSHAKNINTKLGASRRTQAIIFARAKGILA
ncbi:LuxR C-terminal-related transcriptional regulator [Pseudomonas cavernae]|nr:LuxR C-terminal-related transcriptional regulator [Pseudomonas cavernae]